MWLRIGRRSDLAEIDRGFLTLPKWHPPMASPLSYGKYGNSGRLV